MFRKLTNGDILLLRVSTLILILGIDCFVLIKSDSNPNSLVPTSFVAETLNLYAYPFGFIIMFPCLSLPKLINKEYKN